MSKYLSIYPLLSPQYLGLFIFTQFIDDPAAIEDIGYKLVQLPLVSSYSLKKEAEAKVEKEKLDKMEIDVDVDVDVESKMEVDSSLKDVKGKGPNPWNWTNSSPGLNVVL